MRSSRSREIDTLLVGYIAGDAHETFYAGGKIAWVDEILVVANERRRGVGRALMAEFENWAAGGRCQARRPRDPRRNGVLRGARLRGELRLLQALPTPRGPHAPLRLALALAAALRDAVASITARCHKTQRDAFAIRVREHRCCAVPASAHTERANLGGRRAREPHLQRSRELPQVGTLRA